MKTLNQVAVASLAILSTTATAGAQHDAMKGMDMPMKPAQKTPAKTSLKPAEGANIKIIAPKKDQVLKGDSVPVEFKLTKGKRGHHAHAYVDGELMGMFESEKGTLNGIKPGTHTLELRVVAQDHKTELDATDRVTFTTQ
jgi:hypothetical protein